MQWLVTYVCCLVAFLVLDGAWIFLVARKQYDLEASSVIRDKPQLPAGVLFYLIYSAGVVAFAVLPMTRHFNGVHAIFTTYRDVAAWGFGLGFFAYSTFALTNQSIIKDWKYKLAVADMLWGAVLSAIVTLVGFAIFRVLA